MKKKYAFTGKTREFVYREDGGIPRRIMVRQIVALEDVVGPDEVVADAGDVGGWIEHEGNLSREDGAWVSNNAYVFGNAKVFGNAFVGGKAYVYDNAEVGGYTNIEGHANVCGNAKLLSNSIIQGHVLICGNATIAGDGICDIDGDVTIGGDAYLTSSNDFFNIAGIEDDHSVTFFKCNDGSIQAWVKHTKNPVTFDEYVESVKQTNPKLCDAMAEFVKIRLGFAEV